MKGTRVELTWSDAELQTHGYGSAVKAAMVVRPRGDTSYRICIRSNTWQQANHCLLKWLGMSYRVVPLFSSQLYNFGNMKEASSSTTFPQELAEIIQADKVVEPEVYNYYQLQPNDRDISGVPLQCPLMIDYQSADVNNNNHTPIFQQPFSPRIEVSDWRCQQPPLKTNHGSATVENPKKRLNNVCGQNVVNKKLAHADRMQGIGCRRETMPMRRSQKQADKITALQKLVSPYGKTDTASVLQEAHISINLLHDQIKKLLQISRISDDGSLQFQVNKEAETSLRDKGLCLVPISSPEINNIDRNY